MGVRGQCHSPATFTPGKDPVPIVQEAGWAPGPVWIGAENLASTGTRSPDLPARSESLYRLRYPGPMVFYLVKWLSINFKCNVWLWVGHSGIFFDHYSWICALAYPVACPNDSENTLHDIVDTRKANISLSLMCKINNLWRMRSSLCVNWRHT